MQNAAEFIFAERQALGNDQGHPEDMGRDCRDLFDVRFSECDQGKGDIVVVARYQYFRTDDSRFQKRDVELFFFFRIDIQRFALFERDIF